MYPPTLKTKNYLLKAYQPSDLNRFIEIALDEKCVEFMGGATGNKQDEINLFNKGFKLYESTSKRWFWLWGIYKNNVLCGHLELKETEHTNANELEVVYMIHPAERQNGIMTEVLLFFKSSKQFGKEK